LSQGLLTILTITFLHPLTDGKQAIKNRAIR
jgi:hypothetical protein